MVAVSWPDVPENQSAVDLKPPLDPNSIEFIYQDQQLNTPSPHGYEALSGEPQTSKLEKVDQIHLEIPVVHSQTHMTSPKHGKKEWSWKQNKDDKGQNSKHSKPHAKSADSHFRSKSWIKTGIINSSVFCRIQKIQVDWPTKSLFIQGASLPLNHIHL